MVVRPSAPFSLLSSLTSLASGRITSSNCRWLMSAPSMKNRSSRNMMSIIGIRLQPTFSSASGVLNRDMGASSGRDRFPAGQVLQHVHGLQVERKRHLGDLVLEDEVHRQEDDRDEESHRRVHER